MAKRLARVAARYGPDPVERAGVERAGPVDQLYVSEVRETGVAVREQRGDVRVVIGDPADFAAENMSDRGFKPAVAGTERAGRYWHIATARRYATATSPRSGTATRALGTAERRAARRREGSLRCARDRRRSRSRPGRPGSRGSREVARRGGAGSSR